MVLETGGMKGRGRELVRSEVHELVVEKFHTTEIGSEYGMAELNSQAYAKNGHNFETPPWMRIMVRDLWDPGAYLPPGRTGAINIIDLANIESCCFIATDDLGKQTDEGEYEVLGRIDQSDLRGCNLLFAS